MLAAPAAVAQNVADVQVVPQQLTLAVGERREMLATAYDARGNAILEVEFRWGSADPGIAEVEADQSISGVARVTGVAAGATTVSVRVGNRNIEVPVTVSATAGPVGTGQPTVIEVDPPQVHLLPAEEVQLLVRFLKDDGSLAARVPLTWRSYNDGVAAVGGDGRVVGVSPGNTLVEANAQGLPPRRITVQVQAGEWRFMQPIVSLSPARSDTIRVVVPAQSNRLLNPRFLSWRSGNSNVADVTPLGVATGIAAGEARITATGFGQQSSVTVRVHRPVEFLDVTPARVDSVFVPLGGTFQFGARALAADETPIPEAPIVWTVGDTSVLSVDGATGLATGKEVGSTKLSVTTPDPAIPTKTWTTVVVATGLVIDVDEMGLAVGDLLQMRAFFADSLGNRLAPASQVSWTSSDPAKASVDGGGMVVPADFGTVQIVAATPWDNADTANVYVQGRLLFTSTRSGTYDVYTVDPKSPDRAHQILSGPGRKLSAAFSPDGSRIAYVTDRDGNYEVYVARADGSNPQRVTQSTETEASPSWSPDGSRIYFESGAGGSFNIWSMNPDGSDKRQITQTTAPGTHNVQPAVSPDGRTVAFASTRDGNYDIYLMNPDGSNQRNFTGSAANESLPVWAGDSALAFLRESERGGSGAVVRMDLQQQAQTISPAQLPVTDFSLSPRGDLLAVVVASPSPTGGLVNRMYLLPLGEGGNAREVPRAGDSDQLLDPSFRR